MLPGKLEVQPNVGVIKTALTKIPLYSRLHNMNPFNLFLPHSLSALSRTHHISRSALSQATSGQYNTPPENIYKMFTEGTADWVINSELYLHNQSLFESLPVGTDVAEPRKDFEFDTTFEYFEYSYSYWQTCIRTRLKKIHPMILSGTRRQIITQICRNYGISETKYALSSKLGVHYRSLTEWEQNKNPSRTTVVEKAFKEAGIRIV